VLSSRGVPRHDDAVLRVLERNLCDPKVTDPVMLLVIEPAPKSTRLFPGKVSWLVGGMLSTVISLWDSRVLGNIHVFFGKAGWPLCLRFTITNAVNEVRQATTPNATVNVLSDPGAGVVVGAAVGTLGSTATAPVRVGTPVGTSAVGEPVGTPVGTPVVTRVGTPVGTPVGFPGVAEGDRLGDSVQFREKDSNARKIVSKATRNQ
jgi:hypothetical protein